MIFLFLIILGFLVGSFLNVCISRLAVDKSVVFPPSHCPTCQHSLRFWDLIPVLSYLLLRGKCRYCGQSIAVRYPLVEILTAAFFGGMYLWFTDFGHYIFALIFVLLLLITFFTDLENEIIPDRIVIVGITLGLSYGFYRGKIVESLIAMVAGFLFFYVVAKLSYWYYKKEAIGQGDLKFGAMLGACLGLKGLILSLFLAYFLGAIISLLLVGLKIKTFREHIPFGPFLVMGALLFLFFGDYLVTWYLALLG